MFDSLNKRLADVFQKLRRKGSLTEQDIDEAMREIRIALLEADVALPVVKEFIKSLKEKAVGADVIATVSPGQMVVKLVHDHLQEILGSEHQELALGSPPAVIMMIGLQGSGKTTSSGKLGLWLRTKQNKKVLVASLDVQRPAAQQQLEVVAAQAGIASLPIIPGQQPVEITKRALDSAAREGYDVLILDTAGRLHIDQPLMDELEAVKKLANPHESLLVADSLTGQDAVNVAKEFNEKIGVTGIILTRIDGDGRGGAALSMRQITGQPIKFMGVGEKLSELEPFHPERIASRILDMGDVLSLVEKAAEVIQGQEAEAMAKRVMEEGKFDLNDLLSQMRTMKKMGGLGSIMNMMPGMGKLKEQMNSANLDDSVIARQEAIILSMTKQERQFPKVINGSRRLRIAAGSGATVADVNRLLKQHLQMEKMMKQLKKMGKKGMMRGGMANMFPGMKP